MLKVAVQLLTKQCQVAVQANLLQLCKRLLEMMMKNKAWRCEGFGSS
jgi:hypothetical protein